MSISLLPAHVLACSILAIGPLMARSVGAQEFSADIIRAAHQSRPDSSRVYVKGGKLRMELANGGAQPYSAILDNEQQSLTMINRATHQYMVMPFLYPTGSYKLSPIQAMFHPTSSGNTCDYWNGMLQAISSTADSSGPPKLTCSNSSAEQLNGRAAQKWAVTSSRDPGTTYVWIDQSLGVVTKTQDESGAMEFRNIAEGSQPDSLFQVPSGYAKMDMATMLAPNQGSGGTVNSTSNGAIQGAGKTLGQDAAKIAADAARQKADSSMATKARHIFHIP